MATTVAIVSDLHCNSTIAVYPGQGVQMDDGDYRHPSAAQRWLWNTWLEYWAEVDTRRAERLVIVFNGDIVEGAGHHGTTQCVSMNPSDEQRIALEVLKVPLDLKPDEIYFVRGTRVHTGASSSNEERIARYLSKEHNVIGNNIRDVHSWWMLPLDVSGVRIDFTHHGRRGTRPWTEANAVQMLAAEIVYRHASEPREEWPHLVFTGHVHICRDTGNNFDIQVWTLPAWQLKTEYNWRRHAFGAADIGGVIVQCDDGKYDVSKRIYKPPRRPRWKSSTRST